MKTDKEIEKDVKDEIMWEPLVGYPDLTVEVRNGFVTLSGTLDSHMKKIAAENAALIVIGVKGISNNIEIKLPKNFERSDSEIETTVNNALKWSISVPEERIKVTVRDGRVTLSGSVEWEFQKQTIKNIVDDIIGVKEVNNLITIASTAPTSIEIKDKIISAFRRNILLAEDRINVEVSDGKVVLTGEVRSLIEKKLAEKSVWFARGVSQITNELEIIPAEILT